MRSSIKQEEDIDVNATDDVLKMRKKIQLLKKKIHEYHEEKSKQDQKIIKLSVENENLKEKMTSLNNSEIILENKIGNFSVDQTIVQKAQMLNDELERLQERYNYLQEKYENLSQQYTELTQQNYQLFQELELNQQESSSPFQSDEMNRILKKKNQEIEELKGELQTEKQISRNISKPTVREFQAKQDNVNCIFMLRRNVTKEAVFDIEFPQNRYQIKVQSITDFIPDLSRNLFTLFFYEGTIKYQESFVLNEEQQIQQAFSIISEFIKENYVQQDIYKKATKTIIMF